MNDKKKGLAALIIESMPSGKSKGEKDIAADEPMSDEELAANDLIDAIEEKDPVALVDAFKSLMEYCSVSNYESDDDEEDTEEDEEE